MSVDVTEAGRVISRANENKLRAAFAAIQDVLKLLDSGEAEDAPASEAAPVAEAETVMLQEAALGGEYVPLLEKAVRRDGTMEVRVISPGWGTSGYYPAEVLERDGPRAFARGTKMYLDHPTPTEEAERPERSVHDLAAELVSDARWMPDHPKGSGLYADAKVFAPYRTMVEELAPHIGVSIRALGRARQGEAEGRKGPIIEEITTARSIDVVTMPGANGKIIEMFEAAGRTARLPGTEEEPMPQDNEQLQEAEARASTAEAEVARLREALILRDAKDCALQALAEALQDAKDLPEMTAKRLAAQAVVLAGNPPVADGKLDTAKLAETVQASVKEELDYVSQLTGQGSGRITGMGGGAAEPTAQPEPDDRLKKMTESFRAMGLSEKEAEIAAHGRN